MVSLQQQADTACRILISFYTYIGKTVFK
jgi:hypothetical protein